MQHRNDDSSAPSRDDRDDEEPLPKRRRKGQGMEALLAREVGLMRGGAGSTSATFVGSASGIHFIRSVYGAIGSPIAGDTSPEADLVPGEEDRLVAGAKQVWHANEVETSDHATAQLSFDDLLEWSSSYFDNWHPAYPFLHAPTILDRLETVVRDGMPKSHTWDATIIKAIMSLSLADRRQSHRPLTRLLPRSLVFETFDDALQSIQPALTRPATIAGLQAVFCVQLFLVSMLRLNVASRLGGLIVQMAVQLGLHRCPVRFQSFSPEDRQLRKRIFWSIYCVERYICQALGLPLTIRDEDADVCHLNRELHRPETPGRRSDTSSNSKAREQVLTEPFDERLQLLVFLAEHAQLRGSIMELRNKRVEERDKSPDTAIFINARLTQWWNEIEDFMDQAEPAQAPISDLHRAVLETLRHESIIMLNRPLLALPKHTASYASAIHACISAAKSLLSTLHALPASSASVGDEASQVPMMWPSFTWAAWMSSFVMLYGAAEGKVSSHVASRNVDKSLKVLEQLALRESVWPQACAVAIEDLRSVLTQRQDQTPKDVGERSTTTPRTTAPGHQTTNQSQLGQESSSVNDHTYSRPTHVRMSSSSNFQSDSGTPGWSQSQANASDNRPVSTHNTQNATATPGAANGNSHSYVQDSTGHYVPYAGSSGAAFLTPQQQPLTNFATDQPWLDSSFLPKDVPPLAFGGLDPFQGFDIPFWVGQDNTLAWIGNNN